MKRIFSVLLALILALQFSPQVYAQSNQPDSEEPTSVYELIESEIVDAIFSEFFDEISYINAKHNCQITTLTPEAVSLIKQEAIANLHNTSFRFGELMDELTLALVRAKRTALENKEKVIIGDYYTTNHTEATEKSYGALKGKYLRELPQNSSYTVSNGYTITIGSAESVAGYKMSSDYSISSSYTLTAPTFNTLLPGTSLMATHSIAVGIMFGTIVKEEYDLVHITTLETTHITRYVLDEDLIETIDYHTLAHIGTTTYVQKLTSTGYITSTSLSGYKSVLVSKPWDVM